MAKKDKVRRDSRGRALHVGESQRKDGKYMFKYVVDGKTYFLTSWKLLPSDRQPKGTKPTLSLREMEKEKGRDRNVGSNRSMQDMTVRELVERYLATRINVKPNTIINYNFVRNLMEKEDFYNRKIKNIRVSDAKLLLIKLHDDGKRASTIKTVRGVLRPAFQLAVDDDILVKNPFSFLLAGVLVNIYILFHTGMRISEFCGLTVKDIDFVGKNITVDKQLQRIGMKLVIESTKTEAGKRVLPMTEDVEEMFRSIVEHRHKPVKERTVDCYNGFLFMDRNDLPLVAMHWQHRINHMVKRYNDIYKEQLPNITPHVCRHTYCSNMAKSGMNPKTLQYLMGHSDISVTMNTYTHLGLEDARDEVRKLEEARKALDKGKVVAMLATQAKFKIV